MKNLKKLLCIALVAIMTISVVSCGSSDKSKIEKTVKGYTDALSKCDFKSAFEYLDEKPDDSLAFENKEAMGSYMAEKLSDQMAMGDVTEYFSPIINKLIDKMFDSISYEIKDITVNGDEATAKVALTRYALDKLDLKSMINNSDFDFNSFLNELAKKGEIKTEQDATKAVFEKISEMLDEVIDKTEQSTEEKELPLVKKDGNWFVSKDFNEFFNIPFEN